jgi:hypothetical protein
MSTDILAYICASDAGQKVCTKIELPRAPILFGLLIGLHGQAEAMFPVRGRFAALTDDARTDFDETMAYGESYVSRDELVSVLERHKRMKPFESEAHAAFAKLLERAPSFTLAFGFC